MKTCNRVVAAGTIMLCATGANGQNADVPPELANNPAAALIMPYSIFIGAEDCAQRGWHMSAADLDVIQRRLDADGASFAKEDKDKVWQYVLSTLGGRGNTGVVKEQCEELRSVLKERMGYPL
jgi:hypothetical protein